MANLPVVRLTQSHVGVETLGPLNVVPRRTRGGQANTWSKTYTDNTTAREGNNAIVTWQMPLCKDWFSVKTPAGEELLLVKSTDVYNSGSNWSRVKIPGVTRSSASVVVRFTLNNVTTADAGKFYCTRVSDGSTISDCKHVLVVLYRPILIGITVNGKRNVTVHEHETVSFQCDVHGTPPPSIHVQQKETNSIHDVVIKDINCTHTGTYVCVARNALGGTIGKETVTINNVISQPRRCDSSDKYVAMSYDSQSVLGTFLVCSYPKPENHIMEYLDKGVNVIDMSDSPRHKLSRDEGEPFYTFKFSISRMQTRDLGTYKLSVVNEKGTLELFVQLFDQGTTMTNTIIAITSSVTIFIAAVFITVAIVAFGRLKKSHERRAVSSYLSPIRDALASAGKVWYDGYHVYADIDDSEVQGNLPGPRRASNSSSSDDDYEEVGQAIIALHPQPGNQQPASVTSATPHYLTATEDKTSPQPSSSKKPDTPGATSTTPYYLTATEDKTSPQPSSSKKPDTPGATSATPYYLTATEDKTSSQLSSSMTPDTPGATSATPYYLTATEAKTSLQPSSSKTPDTPGATSATPYYLTATEAETSPQPSSSKKPDTPGATSATPYYLTATGDKTSPQNSSSQTPDSASATSATPYYLTATEAKTSPQPSSSKKPDTPGATSATPYYLTATEDKTSPQLSSSMTPDTASATSATPYYLTTTEDKTSPQNSSSKTPDSASAASATPYYLTATSSSEKPYTASATSTTRHHLTDTGDECSPQPSLAEEPDTPTASSTPHYLADAGDESSPHPSSYEKPDTPTGTSAGPYYLTDTEDE
ncbi:mucin-21-like [Haliotis rufescens]|uniref:mucin-21-like n=1 Tax=Haliotis rufescens TaxID=6454 RepID=UPI00201E978C|nr:mucin-21-like [Haliotis rufescens]